MCSHNNYPVVVVLVLVDVDVELLVLVLVVLVLVEVLVEVVVEVEVLLAKTPSQLFPEYLKIPFTRVSKYSSPTNGSVGGVVLVLILPVIFDMCVSLIIKQLLSY